MSDIGSIQAVKKAVQGLLPELAERAQEMEDVRRLPDDLAQKMAGAGVFRLVTPKSFGGFEASPREIVEVIEMLSTANASAGWCGMIACTTAINAAYMEPETAREIYADPMAITGGVFAPQGKAVIEGDHYRVSGRWQWGSGSANCTWLCGGSLVFEDDEMKMLPSGMPDARMMLFPASEVELIDTWHVMGLKGTGSGDLEVKDVLVPKARSVSLVSDTPFEKGALYKFPAFGLLALGVCAGTLGNGRGALDAFRELALAKGRQGTMKTLAQRDTVQAAYAEMEGKWRAARSYLFDEIDRVWEIANSDVDEIPMEARADLRLACTHMTRTSGEITRVAYDIGGGAALFEKSDLQRRFRDAHAATQHIVTAPGTYELVGRILFGLPETGAMV